MDDDIVFLEVRKSPTKPKTTKQRPPLSKGRDASKDERAELIETIEIHDSDSEGPTPARASGSSHPNRGKAKDRLKRALSIIDLTNDDLERPVSSKAAGKAKAATPRMPLGLLENLDSDSDVDETDPVMRDVQKLRRKKREHEESLERAARLNPKQQQADAAFARKLADKEEAELHKVLAAVERKAEGIVFRVVVDIETGLLQDGTPAHADDLARFAPWKQRLMATAHFKCKKFHWIVNYELEKKFEAARETLRALLGKEPEELELFHGTPDNNIESILTGGFRIGGVGGHPLTHGAALGRGIYLAQDAATSLAYCAGANRMFACRVLPGRSTADLTYSNTIPQIAVGSGEFESYSSGPQVVVVRHTDLVLPCYWQKMIEWEAQPNYFLGLRPMMALPWGPLPAPVPLLGPLAARRRGGR